MPISLVTKLRMRDDLYATKHSDVASFTFDERVAAVFPDMIARSVPGYREWLDDIAALAARQVPAQGRAYDMGSALGATTGIMAKGCADRPCEIIGIDNAEAMVTAARSTGQNISAKRVYALRLAIYAGRNLSHPI